MTDGILVIRSRKDVEKLEYACVYLPLVSYYEWSKMTDDEKRKIIREYDEKRQSE